MPNGVINLLLALLYVGAIIFGYFVFKQLY